MNSVRVALGSLALLLAACSTDSNVAGGGSGGTGMVAVRGQVAEVNSGDSAIYAGLTASASASSLTINGIRYDLREAEYAGDLPLAPGMVVSVLADIADDGSRTARQVSYRSELSGPVTTPMTANSFTVLGHTVYWDDRTRFSTPGLVIEDNQRLTISGYSLGNGNIQATYVAATTDAMAQAVGLVTEVEPVLKLNGVLTVYSGQSGFADPLEPGKDVLHVKGSADGASITAVEIEKISLNLGDLADFQGDAEVEGVVTGFSDLASIFFVGGQPVKLSANTSFSGGMPADIANGARLEVEGPLKSDATTGIYYLEAEEVEFEDAIEIAAPMTLSADGGAMIFFDGAMTVLLHETTDSELWNGNACVEVRARQGEAGIVATKVASMTEADCNEVELQGPVVKNGDGLHFSILGMEFDATTIENFYEEEGEVEIRLENYEAFLDRVQDGDLVSVEGTAVPGGAIDWTKAEIER